MQVDKTSGWGVNTRTKVKVKLGNIYSRNRIKLCQARNKTPNSRSTDKNESRLFKPHQPPEDGHLEETGIKEDLEERERKGESTYKNSRPHTSYFSRIGRSQSSLQSDKQPFIADRDGRLKTEKARACQTYEEDILCNLYVLYVLLYFTVFYLLW